MAERSYYKYAERSADSQINWYQVGKDITDMINTERKIREEKRDAIDKGIREDFNTLANAPQGLEGDTSNKFTTDFAEAMKQQTLIDNRLLKSGQMSVKDWTLRRQNKMDGTKTLFDLATQYQQVYKDRMEKFNNGEIQALNAYNMSSIEGFADFSKSRGIIDPRDGTVNIGMMAPNPKTGVMELTKDVMPVSVARGKILAEIPTFKVYDSLTAAEGRLGTEIQSVYKAASLAGAGSITEFMDITKRKGFGEYANVASAFEQAENDMVDSFFANPYNISSVLTENTKKFSAESFTYDKDEAARDKSKILLKIDPNTKIPTLDKSAPHFKEQEKIARDWVKSQFRIMLDRKVEVKADLGQLGRRDKPEWLAKSDEEKKRLADGLTVLGKLYTAKTAQEMDAAVEAVNEYFPSVELKRGNRRVVASYYDKDQGENVTKNFDFTVGKKRKSLKQFLIGASPFFLKTPFIQEAFDMAGYKGDEPFYEDPENRDFKAVSMVGPLETAKPQSKTTPASSSGVLKQNAPATGQGWYNPNVTTNQPSGSATNKYGI